MAESQPVFLAARWQSLAMLNYEVDPVLLQPYVPAGTELDDWRGQTFVSVVGFRFLDTRVKGLPIPFHRNFDEVNLRFYVRRNEADGVRRGVVFIKEIVPRRAIAWVARTFYNERYVALPMRHEVSLPIDGTSGEGRVVYGWKSGRVWNQMVLHFNGPAELPDEDSLEAFITEHYWGYAMQRDGSTMAYQVEHPRWKVWRAQSAEFDCDVETIYGGPWKDSLRGEPSSAFVADGSGVLVRCGEPVPLSKTARRVMPAGC